MNHEELENYISQFNQQNSDNVLKQILDSELLAKAFSIPEGKLILNSAVDLIATNVMKITAACLKDDCEYGKLMPIAYEINTAYKLMTEWARILIKGDEHKKKMSTTK